MSAPAVIDYDCSPVDVRIMAASGRSAVHEQLTRLHSEAHEAGDVALALRIDAHLAYLEKVTGAHSPLDQYIRRTQGCGASGWPEEYVTARGNAAQAALATLGIMWGPETEQDLQEAEGILSPDDAPDAIREAAEELEERVREAVHTDAPFELSVEATEVDAYWGYRLDGAGHRIRLRLNLKNAKYTRVRARQFALHEILGHCLQSASHAARCASTDVPWVRLLSVHAPHQVLLEGLAQALPLFITPEDAALTTRVRLDHYLQLVRAELHLAANAGASGDACIEHARRRVPFWTDSDVSDMLAGRSTDPLLRSHLWAYPAGSDWFAALAEIRAS